jgi:hemerythrin-like domain-containing protein
MTATAPIEVRDMAIVHRTFRAAYDESARLVRAEVSPTPERVTFLADHIDLALGLLHHHHESEDLLLWPKLLERAPEQAATVQRVADQHHDVAAAIERAETANRSWRSDPGSRERDELADSLEALNAALQVHLDDEERHVVPLAATTLTQEEWNALGEHSRAGIPKDKMFVAFGMLLEPLSEDDRRYMMSDVPVFVKVLWRVVGQRSWRSYERTLRQAA